jgi:hypothetical protein
MQQADASNRKFRVAERFTEAAVRNLISGWPMIQPFRHSWRDKDQERLVRLQERLQRIKSRLIDIDARLHGVHTMEKAVTLREFTEKQFDGKRLDDQETDASNPRTAAQRLLDTSAA